MGKKFRVIIVDSRPMREGIFVRGSVDLVGKGLLERLVKQGVKCTYVLVNSVSFIMKEVTKVRLRIYSIDLQVFVGAYSMMANGNLISRAGTAGIALMAHSYHVPFIVCCETYKFTGKHLLFGTNL